MRGASDAAGGWTAVLSAAELPPTTLVLVRPGRHQIVLWRVGDDIHALDNICPHEGYPMMDGRVNDGVITCDWHNFKYRLADGACLVPGEDIRSFPARVRDGQVEVDLTEPEPEPQRVVTLASLAAGVADRDVARAGRDIVRLIELDTPLPRIAEALIVDASRRSPFGWTHGHAIAADGLRLALAAVADGDDGGMPLLHAASSVAELLVRRPPQPWPEPQPGGFHADPVAAKAAFRRAIEEDRTDDLIAGFRGQLQHLDPAETIAWLAAAATDHFLSFGHGAIWVQKAVEILDAVGWGSADPILTSLVRTFTAGTRHDVLPYMRSFTARCAQLAPELPALVAHALTDDGRRPLDGHAFQSRLQDGGPGGAFAALEGALRAGVHPDRLAAQLVAAGAERILQFDPALANVVDRDFGWLDVTHVLTHAHAIRQLIRWVPGPETVRGLFHCAFFVQQVAREVVPAELRRPLHAAEGEPVNLLAAISAAVRQRDPDGAAAAALGFLAAGGGVGELGRALERLSLQDCSVARIVVDHDIKLAIAAAREAADPLHGPGAARILAATARYLAADKRERFTARDYRFASDFVRRGRPSVGTFQGS